MEEVTYEQLGVANALVIGYMMGTYRVIGKGGAQAVANMAGEFVGKELVEYARRRGISLDTWEDARRFLIEAGLTGKLESRPTDDGLVVEIGDCRICPKRVGHYDFPGTVCPWGGLLVGLLGDVLGKRFTSTPRLTAGEVCAIHLVQK